MNTSVRSAAVSLLALAAASGAIAQQPPVASLTALGTGAISGVVVDGTTKAPLADTVVSLFPTPQGTVPRRQLTDDQGRFVFTNLGVIAEGYALSATRFGYFGGQYGSTVGSARIALAAGEWFTDARITLFRPSAISGTVTDERGDPVVDAYVRVLTQVMVGGAPHLATGPIAKTDDRGAYRISGIPPGKYLVAVPNVQIGVTPAVAAAPPVGGTIPEPNLEIDAATRVILGRYPMPHPLPDGRLQIYAPAFFPDSRSLGEARAIDLTSAEDRQGIDFRLQPVPVVRVSGTLTGPPEAIAGMRLRLLATGTEELGDGSEIASTLVAANGAFTFASVPAGQYTIVARAMTSEFALRPSALALPSPIALPMSPQSSDFYTTAAPDGLEMNYRWIARQASLAYWGRARVEVADRDVGGLVVAMQRGVTISGRGAMESGSEASSAQFGQFTASLGRRVVAEPANGDVTASAPPPASMTGRTEPDVFSFEGLMPGQYFLRFNFAPAVKSIIWNGRDMTHMPFDASAGHDFSNVVVTFTNRTPTVTGTIRDDRGPVATGAIVIAFPVEREQWTNFGFRPPRLRAATPATNGTFRLTDLPAGEYFIAAVGADRRDDWMSAQFFEAVSAQAARVAINWGETKSVDLRLQQVQVK